MYEGGVREDTIDRIMGWAARSVRQAVRRHLTGELGYRSKLHRTEVSLLERAQCDPRLNTLVKLSRALGVPAASLLDGIE